MKQKYYSEIGELVGKGTEGAVCRISGRLHQCEVESGTILRASQWKAWLALLKQGLLTSRAVH